MLEEIQKGGGIFDVVLSISITNPMGLPCNADHKDLSAAVAIAHLTRHELSYYGNC